MVVITEPYPFCVILPGSPDPSTAHIVVMMVVAAQGYKAMVAGGGSSSIVMVMVPSPVPV